MTAATENEPVTHVDRAARRDRIIRRCRNGEKPVMVAKDEGLTPAMVRKICKDAGVQFRDMRKVRAGMLPILAQLINHPRKSFQKIGADLEISWQRVQQVHKEAKKAGIKMERDDF